MDIVNIDIAPSIKNSDNDGSSTVEIVVDNMALWVVSKLRLPTSIQKFVKYNGAFPLFTSEVNMKIVTF